jgi:branched-chain amino acid transport system substrate-binding protein
MRSTRSAKWMLPLAVVTALTMSACSNDSSDDEGGDGGSGLSNSGGGETYKIAFQGPLSGDNAQLGINEVNGVELAIKQANESGDYDFTLELFEADDQGDPAVAPTAAASVLQDEAILGVIGPAFSGATNAVGQTYGDANLSFISPSATNPTLSEQGFPTFHRIVPSDNVEGAQAADLFVSKGYTSIVVIDDLSDYGKGVADAIQTELEGTSVTVTRLGVADDTTDYGATAQQVASSGAQALFYGGYDAQAGQLARALDQAGYEGETYTGNGGKSTVFTEGAGPAGDGWFFTCGCSDATVAEAAQDFTEAYEAEFNEPPSTYSPEAFDAANAMIEAIAAAAEDGEPTRESVEEAVDALDYEGITTQIKFDETGEVDASAQVVNLFQQEAGEIKLLGNIKEQ